MSNSEYALQELRAKRGGMLDQIITGIESFKWCGLPKRKPPRGSAWLRKA